MKIKVIAHYDADPSEGFAHNFGIVEISSLETGKGLDDTVDDMDIIPDVEQLTDITIDQGGDDIWYELDLPDYADSKRQAEVMADLVFTEVEQRLNLTRA